MSGRVAAGTERPHPRVPPGSRASVARDHSLYARASAWASGERISMPTASATLAQAHFEGDACPEDVGVPTEDGDSYRPFRQHRWIENELLVAESEKRTAACMVSRRRASGVLRAGRERRGMGAGSREIRNLGGISAQREAGAHVDVAAQGRARQQRRRGGDGEPRWWRHVIGKAIAKACSTTGRCSPRRVPRSRATAATGARQAARLDRHGQLRTIDARIIEVDLRFSDQAPDLTAPAGPRGSCGSTSRGSGSTPTRIAATATASGRSGRTAGSTGTPIPSPSPNCSSTRARPASRSPSTRTSRSRRTRRRPPASAGRSSRLGPRGRHAGAPAPGAALLGDPAHRAAPAALPRQAVALSARLAPARAAGISARRAGASFAGRRRACLAEDRPHVGLGVADAEQA